MDSMHLIPYIEDERLFSYAASCARTLRPEGRGDGRGAARRLRRSMQETERCHALLRRRYENAAHIPAACEWLLDNRWLLLREAPGVLRALRGCPRQRRCRDGLLVTELCRALLQAGNGSVTAERCALFLRGFQSVTVLQRQELLLFPAALRAAVLEGVASQCARLRAASDPETLTAPMAALFGSLRRLGETDLDAVLEEADVCSALLAQESAGVYARMDRASKSAYLDRLSLLAKKRGVEEQQLARELLDEAERDGKHIGFLLFPPRGKSGAGLYIAALILLTLSGSLTLAFSLHDPRLALLLLVPVWSLVKGLTDFALLQFAAPRRLPRLDPEAGVPPEGKTLCVLSVLLGCCAPERLEELRLLSRREGENLLFGLLADLPASQREHEPGDEALLEHARRTVEELNRRYGGGFYLFTRDRSFDGEAWCGRERKRGALLELARLLAGEPSALSVTGDVSALADTRFILSLDADTRVMPGALGELIAAALHPLNAPRLRPDGTVASGYGILHPRIETELESATSTDFSLIFAGPGGCDPYGGLNGELYMDAFDCGGFAGKGLIDAKLLLSCSGRLPEGRILSHDALEGALLRGGYLSDAAVSDAFPDTPLAYFKRQHRWIRGDWQNAPWVFCRAFSPMDRFRLLDSLLRSLLPPATLAAILLGFSHKGAGLALAAWAALLALVQSLLLALAGAGLSRRARGERLRRHTRLLTGVGGAVVRCFMRLWLLPFEAWICLSAIFTALWRMLVSHRRLLQWQTFAESCGGKGLAAHVRAMWPAVVLGVLLMAFSPAVIGKAAGLMWLLSPAAAAALALPAAGTPTLSARDRELLFSAINDSFNYFRELCTPEDHYLPPDNFQQSPPLGAAHRTSPTNIGLGMAAAAVLGETGVIPREEAVNFLDRITTTLEGMERYSGHFYNWYDTLTLRAMEPRVISTVDSGNLCAAMLCARSALSGWGCEALSKRLETLVNAMDFSRFYDEKRELFLISYDPVRGKSVGGCYDLMASEAMLTSYLAVARGQAPLRHWRRLSRAQVQKDGYRGLASWTGTMFEYLMPALFLPLYRSSLLHESARFCLYVQKRRHLPGRPWGISESAFCALDPSLSYRYKAHGCPELALRRGMGDELVIAPYASFLALAVEPAAAVRNLRRIRDLGLWGRWGPMEALDFTPGRCLHADGEPVPCWMAHHVGMSILAAVNALENGAVRRLFLASPEMSAHTLLLQEKLPDGGALIRPETQSVPERPGKAARTPWSLTGGEADRTPRGSLLSNGVYSLRLTNAAESAAALGELCVYGPEGCPVFTLGGAELPGLAPERWEFGEERCRFDYETADAAVSLTRQCAAGELGESLLLAVRPKRDGTLPLALRFTPVLAKARDWEDHRAYWQLGLEAEELEGRLLLRRLPKNGLKELWLCVGADLPLRAAADRDGGLGAAADPLVRCEGQLVLRRGRETRVQFALCLAASRGGALAGAGRMLAESRPAAGTMLRCAALRLGMNAAQIDRAMELVLPLWQNRLADACPRRELWRRGVPGELPILCCAAQARESEELLRAFCLLKSCGLDAELVFLSAEAGAYRRPGLARLEKVLASVGLEALLGARGGVFFLPPEAERAVESRAAVCVGRPASALLPMPRPVPAERTGPVPLWHFEEESFVFRIKGALPPRIWQHILSDGRLGAFAADFGPAGLWFQNAREMRLIPPPGSIRASRGQERLCAVADGETFSLFADGKSPCEIRYAPGLAVWKKRVAGREIETAMFLDPAAPLRLLLIRGAEGLPLVWDLEPFAGGPDASCLRIETRENLAVLSNEEAFLPDTPTLLSASVPCRFESGFLPRALRVFCTAEPVTVLALGCAAEEELARALAPGQAEEALDQAQTLAQSFAGRLRVDGVPPAFAHAVNVWVPYQARVCRLLGRSSLYQSGGAVGFRDQLQDSVNLLLLSTAPARRQILECCRRQYREGDVQHWWHRHPDGGRGLRSRCSDDLLWLVWALCEYCAATGELELCAVREPWLRSAPLREGERDRYEAAAQSEERAPVLEHAYAALALCVRRGFGPHGLPWIGSGDWNDGLDRAEGESVWLGWFLSCCAGRFADLLERLGDGRAGKLRALAERVGRAAEATFDGRRYPRAWTADGRELGGGEAVDSLAQSWAVFCPYADHTHAESALDCALARLVDREHRIVRLLDPPYTPENSPGYCSGYGQGFRENGGQYTHAAIWLALAALRLGRRSEGIELLRMLLPETHDPARYEAEPFVLPADVCAARGHEGLAGWTWYTGSAGWFYRVVTEELLGLRLEDGELRAGPGALAHYRVKWRGEDGGEREIER
ncbi:MAG: glucoamylase family protein [Eubacteriales bacterium]|nr:glucoamylase family protein [Eubacteriales bacterium]